jgi:signal transduction histidine kinase
VRSDETLFALDAATRAIAGELDLDKVLQLIVDSVRELIGSQYAALGIDDRGQIELFITSGITAEERARIGPTPRGHGLLGTIIREGRALRIPDIAGHPESYGFPPHHPAMHSLLGVPVVVAGETIGNFYLTEKIGAAEFDDKDQQLVELFAVHAGIAIQNARLHQQLRDLAVVDERLRISRDLHDGIIQGIYSVGLSLEDVPELIEDGSPEAVERIDRAIDRLHMTIGDIRTFITGLGTPPGTTLQTAVQNVVTELTRDTNVEVDVDVRSSSRLDGALSGEATNELLQILREALSNAVRHSGTRRATVSLSASGEYAVLVVADDGRGFDPAAPSQRGHFGLANLRNRAAAVDGELEVDAGPGRGTRIIVRLPLLDGTETPHEVEPGVDQLA